MLRTKIYINSTLVDLVEDTGISLNFAIADITKPDKRNTSFSKTIRLPGTKVNNLLFSNIFEISKELVTTNNTVNFTPDFNPNLKAPCKIVVDDLDQFIGVVQLLQITIENGVIEYEVCVYGKLKNIFLDIEGIKLTDLDFSEYDHLFTKANQRDSWATRIQKDGANYVNFSAGNPTGEGYVYPIIDYGYRQVTNEYEAKNLLPAIYVKNYIDKIFERTGFTYTSAFFDSVFFKRLIIPFSGEPIKLSQAEVNARKFSAEYSSNLVLPDSGALSTNYKMTFPDETLDPSGVFALDALGFGRYTVNKTGYYNLTIDLKATMPDTAIPSSGVPNMLTMYLNIFDASGVPLYGVYLGQYQSRNAINIDTALTIPNSFLQKGWYVKAEISYNRNLTILANTKFYNTPIINPLAEGETLLMNSAVPKDINVKDFFNSIIRMFNLYINPDPTNETNLLIEPLKDFYSGATIIDWTDKVDLSKDIIIKPVTEIEGKQYTFSYKDDKDFFNETYKNDWGLAYGTKGIQVNNDFVKGEKKFELLFSPTPSGGNANNAMAIPRFIKSDPTTGAVSPFEGVNIRILYYGGVKSAGGSWKYISYINTGETAFPASGPVQYYYTTETDYPYAGHLDDPLAPTLDLLFDMPKVLFFGTSSGIGAAYTTNNLYNLYYKQFIDEITDKDSKLVILYIKFDPIDIFNLNFKNLIHIDGINYRLNKIYDHNPIGDETTKVELIKIKKGVPFVASVDTAITINDPIYFDLVDGSANEVQNIYSNTPYHTLEGGENEVRDAGATNPQYFIEGGKD